MKKYVVELKVIVEVTADEVGSFDLFESEEIKSRVKDLQCLLLKPWEHSKTATFEAVSSSVKLSGGEDEFSRA